MLWKADKVFKSLVEKVSMSRTLSFVKQSTILRKTQQNKKFIKKLYNKGIKHCFYILAEQKFQNPRFI